MSKGKAEGDQRPRLWRTIALILVPIALFISLCSWALSSPVGASPDDDFHMASIWCAQGIQQGRCEQGDKPNVRLIPEEVARSSGCYAFKPGQSGDCVDEFSANKLVAFDRGNFNGGGYPPVYYLAMSAFVGSDVQVSVVVMRFVNAALYVALCTALYLMLPRRHRPIVLLGTLVTLVPFGMFILPSVNPSSWAVISAATLWLALVGFYEAHSRSKLIGFGILATLSTVIGAGARADVATYCVLTMIIVAILKGRRTREFLLRSLLPVALALLCFVLYRSGSQAGVLNPSGSMSGREVVSLFFNNLIQLPTLWAGALGQGGLGWLDTYLPPAVWFPALIVAGGVTFFGLRRSPLRKSISVALIGLALVLVPLYVLVNDRLMVGAGVQPRYIYPLMILLTGVCLFGLHRLDLGLSRMQFLVIFLGLAIANTVALHTNLRRYVTGAEVQGSNLDVNHEWWWNLPIGPNPVWIIGSIAFVIVVAGAIVSSLPVTVKREKVTTRTPPSRAIDAL